MLLLIDCGSSYIKNICSSLKALDVSCEVQKVKDLEKTNIGKYAGFLISGSPEILSDWDETRLKKYLERFGFVKTCGVPVLGICHGHQVIGLLFGSTIGKGKMINSSNKINIHGRTSLLKGFGKSAVFEERHREYISLPKSFKLLAGSDNCKVECMKHSTKNIFGVQFHPEISGDAGMLVFKNFCRFLD